MKLRPKGTILNRNLYMKQFARKIEKESVEMVDICKYLFSGSNKH